MTHTTTLRQMRQKMVALALGVLLVVPHVAGAAESSTPRTVATPAGQIKIVSVNARQNAVLGIKRFEDMFELAKQLRKRPLAFNGGFTGGVSPPDVIAVSEMRPSNVEIFEHIFEQRFKTKYRLGGFEDAASQFIYNPARVTLDGEVTTWDDVCLGESSAGNKHSRFYQFARFTEIATGAPFVVAAVHIPKSFGGARPDCYQRNISELKRQLAAESAPTFVVGDFNKRPVETSRECDPDEDSPAQPWWTAMTTAEDGATPFVDSVRFFHRARHLGLEDEWTHEQKAATLVCDGSSIFRRARIDYIFSRGAIVAEAHADHPGWAGEIPGTKTKGTHKYSDHRWVWGRFVLTGPERPSRPLASQERGGVINLAWSPVEGATGYLVYRAIGDRDFDELAKTDSATTTYRDVFTEDGTAYRYAIAALGVDLGQSLESLGARQTADSRGPRVSSVTPGPGASGVDQRVVIKVVYDEGVAPDSVTNDRIRLYRGGKRIPGTLIQQSRRVLLFDPNFPLWKGIEHRVEVKPVQDALGNLGGSYSWGFTTEAPPPKERR
jgi:endonuclease/exonuclease/phosphatase family metal-dependent hydrolase